MKDKVIEALENFAQEETEALESLAKQETEAHENIHNQLQELIELVNKINEKRINDDTVSKSEKLKSIIS